MVTGGNDLASFSDGLFAFGVNFKLYSSAISGMDFGVAANTKNICDSMTPLIEMANNLPKQGGLVQLFSGDSSLGNFSASLLLFGINFKLYSDAISGIGFSVSANTKSVCTAIGMLTEMADSIPINGGLIRLFTGDNSISKFSEKLIVFGENFGMYANRVSEINTSQLYSVNNELRAIIAICKSMEDVSLSGVTKFTKSLSNLASTGLDSFIKAFTDGTDRVRKTASDMVTTFTTTINSKKSTITSGFSTIMSEVISSINDKKSQFTGSAMALMTEFANGIKAGRYMVLGAASSAFDVSTKNFASEYNRYYSVGAYMVEGFANGITANTYKAKAKAQAMAKAASDAAAKQLEVNSPSRVMYQIGDYGGQGFVNGLGAYEDKAGIAGAMVAQSAVDNVKDAISRIAEAISGNLDTQPTIRPVLDLTNVEAGARKLGKVFGNGNSVALSSSFGTVSQNGTSPSVIVNMTVNGAAGQDVTQLADIVSTKINTAVSRRSKVWR